MSADKNSTPPDMAPKDEEMSCGVQGRKDLPIDFLADLLEGNLGLAMTYWVYGVLGGVVWAIGILAFNPERESDLEKLIYFMMGTYYFVVYIGIWRAANKYAGSRLWAVLAKFVVVIVVLPAVILLLKWIASY